MTFLREEETDSLLSTIITFYILILLYFPSSIILFSPTLISTLILLLSLLRLGASQNDFDQIGHEPDPGLKPDRSFIEWDVRAPLEVIYEGEEAEEEYDGVSMTMTTEFETNVIQRYASLSLFYPESDTDDSSEGDIPAIGEWDSPENYWEDDFDFDRGSGLIEIELDYNYCKGKKNCEFDDEDNLIEIDLSPVS